MLGSWWGWSLVGVYLILIAVIVGWLLLERRRARTLPWPRTTTQRQVERYGTRFMVQHGWTVSLIIGHATISYWHARRDDGDVFLVFLAEAGFFSRLLAGLRRSHGWLAPRTVIVLLEPPTPVMVAEAIQSRLWLMESARLPALAEKPEETFEQMAAERLARPR